MPWPVTINGKTYTLADFAPYTYATSFPNILQDVADVAQAVVDAAGASGVPAAEATIASAATTHIGALTNYRLAITGTTTITSFGTSTNRTKLLRFTDSLILTHNATSLFLPGAANILTQAGDTAVATSDASGNWRVRDYFRASGEPLVQRASFRNRIINGDFRINQRGAASTSTAYAAGTYIMDRWKAGANGATLSFSTGGNGDVTVSITAGSLVQIIEGGLYMPEGGLYTLSWTGTALARFYQGSAPAFRSGPITIGIGANANTAVEFSTGTVTLAQFEPGTTATPFERRDDELRRCQRYYFAYATGEVLDLFSFLQNGTNYIGMGFHLPVPMRVAPTVVLSVGTNGTLASGMPSTPSASPTRLYLRADLTGSALAWLRSLTANAEL